QRPDSSGVCGQNSGNFLAHNFHNVIYSRQRPSLPFLQCLDDALGHWHAEVCADKRFLELVPVDRFTGKMLGEGLKESHLSVEALKRVAPMLSCCAKRSISGNGFNAVEANKQKFLDFARNDNDVSGFRFNASAPRARADPNLFLPDQEYR